SFGVYHAAGTGSATWCDFSRFIFECTELAWGSKPTVNAILTEEYPTPAKRPANSRLDSQKLNSDYGLSLPHWTEATRKVVEQILRENS
ncbi:MAG: sugar nucleotide-binding protein, partial [Pseudomonadota bacterium]